VTVQNEERQKPRFPPLCGALRAGRYRRCFRTSPPALPEMMMSAGIARNDGMKPGLSGFQMKPFRPCPVLLKFSDNTKAVKS
jgi:hypothetical protein